jgi:uncharacterized protein YndB with AHSA1/START domain
MSMPKPNPEFETQTLDYTREVEIEAPVDVVFESVLAEMGPEGAMPDGSPFSMKLEPWPGGRWFRDLGNDAGHFWGHVQVIKPPKLIEVCGPMFASYPATNHIQYRLTPGSDDATRLKFTHRAFGWMPKDFMKGVEEGWAHMFKQIAEIADRKKRERRQSK